MAFAYILKGEIVHMARRGMVSVSTMEQPRNGGDLFETQGHFQQARNQ